MELKKYIGNKIKEFRISRGMSQDKLADLLETTKQAVSRYERGNRQANQDILFNLSNIFKVSIDDFFPNCEESNKSTSNEYNYLPTAISAGLPINVDAITESDTISLPNNVMGKWAGKKDILISSIYGDSMDKIMPNGSLIAIKPISLSELYNGDIVVFSTNGEYSVKHYYKHDDKLVFKPNSYDDIFHDQTYSVDDDVTIHGKVVLYIVEMD